MLKKHVNDLTAMIILSLFSLVLYFWAIPSQIPIATWNTGSVYTAQTVPKLIAAVLFISSLLGIFQSGIQVCRDIKRRETTAEKAPVQWKSVLMPLAMALVIVAYYFLFNKTGFLIATAILVPVMMLLLECRKWKYLVCIYVFGLAIYGLFKYVLLIRIP